MAAPTTCLRTPCRKYGIEVRFADYRDPESFGKLIDERTKAVYIESIGNPLGNVVDIAALAEVAHAPRRAADCRQHRASPYLCRPFEHGADIVVHSLTKYLGGHGNSMGGDCRFRQIPLGRAQATFQAP
jgi:O-acetylhomoserine (thiol)-lyase